MHLKLIKPILFLVLCLNLSGCEYWKRHFFPHDEQDFPTHRCNRVKAFPGSHDELKSDGYGCAYENNFELMDAGIRRKQLSKSDGKRQAEIIDRHRSFNDESFEPRESSTGTSFNGR